MKKTWAVPVIASILILGSLGLTKVPTQAFAGDDPENIVYENGSPDPSDGLYIDMAITANDFVLGEDLELTDVHFILQDDNGNGLNVPIQYEIRENDGTSPGALITSGNGINVETEQIAMGVFGPRLMVWFDFEEPIPLFGGVTYWLVLHVGNDINDNTKRSLFWESSDVNIGFTGVSSFIGEPELEVLFDTWFQLTSKQIDDDDDDDEEDDDEDEDEEEDEDDEDDEDEEDEDD